MEGGIDCIDGSPPFIICWSATPELTFRLIAFFLFFFKKTLGLPSLLTAAAKPDIRDICGAVSLLLGVA